MVPFIRKYYPLFPIVGLLLYVVLFCIALQQYPGGSLNEPNELGYSHFHNFLCDVMNIPNDIDVVNHARGLGVIAHIFLSLAMISFFYVLPEIFDHKNRNTFLIRLFGMSAMTAFVLMATDYHDLIVSVTAVLGSTALIPFFIELQSFPNRALAGWSYLCFLLSIVVYFIFVTKIGFYYLPFLQKITFVIDAIWVTWVSIIVFKESSLAVQSSFE